MLVADGELRAAAIRLLAHAPLSEAALRHKLSTSCPDFEETQWQQLALELKRAGYLHDRGLALQSLKGRLHEKGRSLREIEEFFYRHEISREVWMDALQEILNDIGDSLQDWLLQQARRRLRRTSGKAVEKLLARLSRAGFPYLTARQAIMEHSDENE